MTSPARDLSATRKPLTNTAINATLPGDILYDDRMPGLYVRCNTGGRSFMLYYRTKVGKQRRLKIGAYPVISIAAAREIAKSMLVQVAAGNDPMDDREKAKGEITLDKLWERCERDVYPHWQKGPGRKIWHYHARLLYKNNVSPKLGKKGVSTIDYDDVVKVHQALRSSITTANRTIAVLGRMLKLAERWKLRPTGSNPCQHVERFPEQSRRRYATPAELKRLGPILERKAEQNPTGVAFLYLLMFSGARPSEIEKGTPDMLQRVERAGDVYGVLRLPNGKTGARDVFLPPQAMRVLDKLPPNRKHLAGRPRIPRVLWENVRQEAGLPDLWARDMRRTFATVALSNGVPIGVVGELLGHASTQTTKIYAKLLEDGAHTAAASTAALLDGLLRPTTDGTDATDGTDRAHAGAMG